MGLFQKTVVQKYLKQFDAKTLENKYNEFIAHFGKPEIQENIRNSKEEQYQEGFLRDLFVNILGYTLNPNTNYNLITENKNLKDSKKADGAIILESKVKAVIELKGTDTTDLAKVENQAFGYKNNQIGCVYVITSNFEKLRFYIEDATNFEEFNLFTLTHEQFNLFYLCLSFDSISKGLPLAIKHESTSKEEQITNDFYKAYSTFKRDLYQNLVSQNPQFDPLLLFKKSQKLLDRFLFLFFAEDRLLLPPNSVRLILNDWRELQERDVQIPLYDRYKKYFEYLNTGYKGKRYDVFAYNGGLFKPDEVLDTVTINDDLLYKHTLKLSEYDFVSEVDVNILGHIFENSLNEIDEIKAELEGYAIDKSKTKRKKDGVFYTPKYITKYIVENTVGKLCTDKKNEIGIKDEDYITDKKRQTNTKKALLDKLAQYRQWLLQITICDPACGSGAFLNQALDFLITEHQYIDELQAKIYGASIIFSDVEKSILENNIYGVDLNEESVEIAKLSLWLRTAQPNRKLNDLNNNIKCGNSLIDDPAVADDKAFNWQQQFPEIFAKGGFDVVIGNPPYVRQESIKDIKPTLEKTFMCFNGTADLYTYFYERGLKILKDNGLLGYISPNKFINSNYGENLRKYLSNYQINTIIDFGELPVFNDASTFPAIFIIIKVPSFKMADYSKVNVLNNIDYEIEKNLISINIVDEDWKFFNPEELGVFNTITKNTVQLSEYVNGEIKFGIKTGLNEVYIISEESKNALLSKDSRISQFIKPFIDGDNVRKYNINYQNKYLIVAKHGLDLEDYPVLIDYFTQFKDKLQKRSDKGDKWYQLRTCSYYDDFHNPKILYPDIALEPRFTYDATGYYPNATLFIIPKDDKYLLCLLNSKVAWFYFQRNCPVIGDINNRGRLRLKTAYVSSLPVKTIDEEQRTPFIELANNMLSMNAELKVVSEKFQRTLIRKFPIESLSTKLKDWYQISFADFIKELSKKKVKLSLSEEAEWEDYFLNESKIALELKSQIEMIDSKIDKLIYQLYGLSKEEIKTIENSVK